MVMFIGKKIIVIVFMVLCSKFAAGQFNIKKQNDSAEIFIKETIKNLNISGLAVAVVHKGKIEKLATYGKANFDWNIDVDLHTNFQIASVSKLLLTTLVMKTIHNKKMALEDEVGKFIEDIPDRWKGLKIKHLLNHTSGIRDFKQNRAATTLQAIEALKDSTLAFPYGTRQAYASGDFTLLIYILEKIYGVPYAKLLKQELTVPLNMKDGAFDFERMVSEWTETDSVSKKSTTYYMKDGKRVPYKYVYPHYTYGAGGYYASISDMANWAVGIDTEVLFPKSFEKEIAYTADPVGNNVSGWSKIGWSVGRINGIRFGGHSGGPALGDVIRFPDQELTIIVLSNDGELLPYFASALATFYVPGFTFSRQVTKFKRTKAL